MPQPREYVPWPVQCLKKGQKIYVAGLGNDVAPKMTRPRRIVVIPLLATVKAGDIIYCKYRNWIRCRYLYRIDGDIFHVREREPGPIVEVPFENVYGQVYSYMARANDEGEISNETIYLLEETPQSN